MSDWVPVWLAVVPLLYVLAVEAAVACKKAIVWFGRRRTAYRH